MLGVPTYRGFQIKVKPVEACPPLFAAMKDRQWTKWRLAMIARLPQYVAFAEEVCRVTERMAGEATAWLKTTGYGYKQTFRDRALTGLCLKILGSFRALIDDARAGRAEAMHHLKTMVESFIYFHYVAADTSPERANHLFAKVLHDKAKFIRDNMQPGDEERIEKLERDRDRLLAGAPPLPSVERLAKSYGPSLGSWYSAVYRLACEPAHLGDLQEFMPEPDAEVIEVSAPITAELRATVAIDRACELSINVIGAVLQVTTASLHADVDALRAKLAALRDPKRSRHDDRRDLRPQSTQIYRDAEMANLTPNTAEWHAHNVGMILSNLQHLEFLARSVLAAREESAASVDLRSIKVGDWVQETPVTNYDQLRDILKDYNAGAWPIITLISSV